MFGSGSRGFGRVWGIWARAWGFELDGDGLAAFGIEGRRLRGFEGLQDRHLYFLGWTSERYGIPGSSYISCLQDSVGFCFVHTSLSYP